MSRPVRMDHQTWYEIDTFIAQGGGVILPVGSTEQHGPIGLVGTDAICATAIAEAAACQCDALVAPTLALTPAPFNSAFPGTVSISEATFSALAGEVIDALAGQGFPGIYILNAHGANLAPLQRLATQRPDIRLRIRSWWDFDLVNVLRDKWYGDWEGMHATPSEVSITQALIRCPAVPEIAKTPPRHLSQDYIRAHAGDRHGPPDAHRRDFPDGRVGSHSVLARPEHGAELIAAASAAVSADYREFLGQGT